MTGSEWINDPLVHALAWTLVHFVWQGALAGLAAFVVLRVLRPAQASARYLIATTTMAVMLLAAVGTFALIYRRAPIAPAPVAATAITTPAAEPRQTSLVTGWILTDSATSSPLFVSPANGRTERASLSPAALLLIVAGWTAGVLVLSIRLIGGWIVTRRLARQAVARVSPRIERTAREMAARLELAKVVAVMQSSAVAVPTLVGWAKPVVLLPAAALAGLSSAQLEAIIAHELAHVRRHDYLINLLQAVVETLLFYHPAVWWVSAQVRTEREHCCDDLAVAVCGDRLVYVSALAELTALSARPGLALAATDGSLLHRVRRLLGGARPQHEPPPAWALLALLATLIGSAGTFGASADAQPPSDASGAPTGGVDAGVAGGVAGGVSGAITEGVADRAAPGTRADAVRGLKPGPSTGQFEGRGVGPTRGEMRRADAQSTQEAIDRARAALNDARRTLRAQENEAHRSLQRAQAALVTARRTLNGAGEEPLRRAIAEAQRAIHEIRHAEAQVEAAAMREIQRAQLTAQTENLRRVQLQEREQMERALDAQRRALQQARFALEQLPPLPPAPPMLPLLPDATLPPAPPMTPMTPELPLPALAPEPPRPPVHPAPPAPSAFAWLSDWIPSPLAPPAPPAPPAPAAPPASPALPAPPAPPASVTSPAPPAPPARPAPPAPPASPAPPAPPAPPGVIQMSDGSRGNMSWSDGSEKVEMKWTGPFRLADDDRDIAWIAEGAVVSLTDGSFSSTRVDVRGLPNGQIERTFYRNGTRRDYEPEGRAFLAAQLQKVVRRSGMFAKDRVERFLKRGGVDAVLAEIQQIDSSHASRIYYTELMKQAPLSESLLTRVLKQLPADVASDHDKSVLLTEIAKLPAVTAQHRVAIAGGSKTIRSDHDQWRTLAAVVASAPLTTEVATAVLDASTGISSSHNRANLLIDIGSQNGLTQATTGAFMAQVRTLGSSHDQQRVLTSVAAQPGLPEAARLEAVRATTAIQSDHSKRQALTAYLSSPDPKLAAAALESAKAIASSHDRSTLLLQIVTSGGLNDQNADAFFAAAVMPSSHDMGRVLQAVAAQPNLSERVLRGLLLTSARIGSSVDRGRLLVTIATSRPLSGELRQLYLDSANGLTSQLEQNRALAALVRAERPGK